MLIIGNLTSSTGQPIEEIESNVGRGKFSSADEAKAFGLVDEVFGKPPQPAEEGSAVKAA